MNNSSPESRKSSGYSQKITSLIAVFVSLFLLGATFKIGSDKGLVTTITPEEWGRDLYGISSAITELKFGIGWFAVSTSVEGALLAGGLAGSPDFLRPLGVTFPDNLRDPWLLQHALESAWNTADPPSNQPEPGGYYSGLRGASGDDVGFSTYSMLSIKLFGLNIPGFYYLYFVILAISLLLYIVTYRREAVAIMAISLPMIALYSTLLSSIVGESGLDIKDPRYLSTLALIPVFHIVIGWLCSPRRLRALDAVALSGQIVILAFAIHVRASTLWTAIALGLLWVFVVARLWYRGQYRLRDLPIHLSEYLRWKRSPHHPNKVLSYCIVSAGMIFMILSGGHFVPRLLAHPLYSLEGDKLSHTFWHGLYYSLQFNPDWEAKYAYTVDGAKYDDMPIAAARKAIAELPVDEQKQYLSPRNNYPTTESLERFSRILFFKFLRNDPQFVLTTFLLIRPTEIISADRDFYWSISHVVKFWNVAVIGVSMLLPIWFATINLQAMKMLTSLVVISISFTMVASIPNWMVSVTNLTMIDHFIWSLIAIISMLTLVGASAARVMKRMIRTFMRPPGGNVVGF